MKAFCHLNALLSVLISLFSKINLPNLYHYLYKFVKKFIPLPDKFVNISTCLKQKRGQMLNIIIVTI